MAVLRSVVKSLVPPPVRRMLRAHHRNFVFRRALKRFMRDPRDALASSSTIRDLIYGWGNEVWSAQDEYLVVCLEQSLQAKGPILECGSGLSTILVGAVAKTRGLRHWALEHAPEWAQRVQRVLDDYGVDSVMLCVKPLRNYGQFDWYDPPLEAMPHDFSLMICDGPPGDTRGGRYGLVPVLRSRMAPACTILLDDAAREDERVIANRWKQELGATFEILGTAKPYIKMVRDAGPQRS